MTSSRGAFIANILANPTDDLTRMVYADWLEEHNEPERAEFIRAQIILASREEWESGYWPARETEIRLLQRHLSRWQEQMPPIAGIEWAELHRGMFHSVRIRDTASLRQIEECQSIAPIDTVIVSEASQPPTAWLPPRLPATISHLEFESCHFGPSFELEEANENDEPTEDGRRRVVSLEGVQSLKTIGCDIDESWLSLLLQNLPKRQMIDLSFDEGWLTDYSFHRDAMRYMIPNPESIGRIERLSLPGNTQRYYGSDDFLSDRFIQDLGQTMLAPHLKLLDLSNNMIRDAGLTDLLTNPNFAGLRKVNLRSNQISRASVGGIPIISRKSINPIQSLNLSRNNSTDQLVRDLSRIRFTDLKLLWLSAAELTDRSIQYLLEADWFTKMRLVDLSYNDISNAGIKQLADTKVSLELLALDLAGNELTDACIPDLVRILEKSPIEWLNLAKNRLSDDAILALPRNVMVKMQ
jgi:uncharacterized protein (TIGR02996 family)